MDTDICVIFPFLDECSLEIIVCFSKKDVDTLFPQKTAKRQSSEEFQSVACSPAFHSSLTEILCGLGEIHIASRSGYQLEHGILKQPIVKALFVSCHSEEAPTVATYYQQLSLVVSLSSDQTSMLCLIHELLSNEGQIPGKQKLNQTYYLVPIPLLHFTFFTLTLISSWAINEIYHWHQLGRGGKRKKKRVQRRRREREAKPWRAEGMSHGSQLLELKIKIYIYIMLFPADNYPHALNKTLSGMLWYASRVLKFLNNLLIRLCEHPPPLCVSSLQFLQALSRVSTDPV